MRNCYLLLLLSFLLTNTCCSQKPHTPTIAIGFYNCENFFDTVHAGDKLDEEFTPTGKYRYTANIYHKKLNNIANVLGSMATTSISSGPVLVGLAEIENGTVLNDLVRQPQIVKHHYKYVWFDGPDERGIDVALLYNPVHFKVLQAQPLHVDLTSTGEEPHTRDVLFVSGILDGDTVHVFVNHWPSRRGGEDKSVASRAYAAGIARHTIDSLMQHNPAAKVIVMGDLNDNPVDASVANVLGALPSTDNIATTGLYDPWAAIYNSGKGTLAYKHHWDLFDQIIVSGAFMKQGKWRYSKAEIFNPDFIVDHYKGNTNGYPHRSFAGSYWINGYSDHFPVLLYLAAH